MGNQQLGLQKMELKVKLMEMVKISRRKIIRKSIQTKKKTKSRVKLHLHRLIQVISRKKMKKLKCRSKRQMEDTKSKKKLRKMMKKKMTKMITWSMKKKSSKMVMKTKMNLQMTTMKKMMID